MSRPTWTLLLVLAAFVQVGCYSVSYGVAGYERHGVWLPDGKREAYRPRTRIIVQGHELLFDEALRVYRVTGQPGYFYSASRFYRGTGLTWETARAIDGRWSPLATTQLPPTLVGLETEVSTDPTASLD